VDFVGLAQEGLHDGGVPGGLAGGDVVEGFNLRLHLFFADFQHFCNFALGNLGVVLQDGVEGDGL
jgi:hypothetical protein